MEARRDSNVNKSHILLRGGTRKIYSHGLSLSQIQTLSSITQAFVPDDLSSHSISTSKVPAPQSPLSHEVLLKNLHFLNCVVVGIVRTKFLYFYMLYFRIIFGYHSFRILT